MKKAPSHPLSHKYTPKASRRKRLIHTFYLIQPILQFFALIAVIGIFSRCSPLASSTDKSTIKSTQEFLQQQETQKAQLAAEEELIKKNLKELSSDSVEVISDSELEKISATSLHADEAISESQVKQQWQHRNMQALSLRRPKIIRLLLRPDKIDKLWNDGSIRIDIAEYLRGSMNERARQIFLQELKSAHEKLDLGATIYISIPDAQFQKNLSQLNWAVKVSLSMPSEDKAILELTKGEPESANKDQPLLEAALRETKQMAIVVE